MIEVSAFFIILLRQTQELQYTTNKKVQTYVRFT